MAPSSHTRPHPIDIAVGQRVRYRREDLDVTQSDLARALGITYQQVQKYERGVNRISASKLHEIARVLEVTCGWLMGEHGAPSQKDLPPVPDDKAYKMLNAWLRLDRDSQDAVLNLASRLARRKP